MKKQILILVIALMGLVSVSWGQAVHNTDPRGTACVDDPLHPVAGKSYTYQLLANPTGGNFLWWATKDPNFVTTDAAGVRTYNNGAGTLLTVANGALIATGANYNTAGTANSVNITWSDSILANTVYNTNPTFVTTLYNGTACADNLKVYQLDPIKAFTVDILNYDGTTKLAYDVAASQCIDKVSKATFVTNAMQYEYGRNIFVYEVIAANFTNYWTPTWTLTGLNAAQTYVIQWTYDAPSTWNASTVWHAATDRVNTSATDTSTGVSIFVRVTVTNNNFENNATDHPTGVTIALAIDGTNSVGSWDINNGSGAQSGTLCTATIGADQLDIANQTLLPRPSLIEGTTSPTAPNLRLVPGNSQN
jgi:hypothetical protein